MQRYVLIALLALVGLLPQPALAHGFGQRYTLPVPLWLYLWGAAAAVVLSFVLVGFFVGESHAPHRYPRHNMLRYGWFRALFASRPTLLALRLISVGLFGLVILTGLFGNQVPSLNWTPTFVWVIWWVGLSIFTALVGNLWALMNPWKITFEWLDGLARRLGLEGGLELDVPYPARWGVWPALLLYFGFVWVELIFEGSPTPFNIAFLALLYTVVTWTGMAVFGVHPWLRHGEAFSVFFGILAKFAPTEVRVADPATCEECGAACRAPDGDCVNCYECFEWAEPRDRELNLRPLAVGLIRPEPVTTDRLAFIVFMLASVTVDGLFVTPLWVSLQTLLFPAMETVGEGAFIALQTLGLILLPVLFLLVYFGFSLLVRSFGGSGARLREVAAAFVYSLVPIALAYQIAHYYTLLLIQGQSLIALASDPFGWGWNLFGTAAYTLNATIVDAAFVWYSQVALIVAGHVIAVYLAHVIALRWLRSPTRALRSQYPMLALMVLYTISSLWIISQPIIEREQTASAPITIQGGQTANEVEPGS